MGTGSCSAIAEIRGFGFILDLQFLGLSRKLETNTDGQRCRRARVVREPGSFRAGIAARVGDGLGCRPGTASEKGLGLTGSVAHRVSLSRVCIENPLNAKAFCSGGTPL